HNCFRPLSRMYTALGSSLAWFGGQGLLALPPWLPDVVPQADDRLVSAVMLESEYAHTRGAAEEIPPGPRRQPEPAGGDHADDVPAGERQLVAVDAAHRGDEPVGPGRHVFP